MVDAGVAGLGQGAGAGGLHVGAEPRQGSVLALQRLNLRLQLLRTGPLPAEGRGRRRRGQCKALGFTGLPAPQAAAGMELRTTLKLASSLVVGLQGGLAVALPPSVHRLLLGPKLVLGLGPAPALLGPSALRRHRLRAPAAGGQLAGDAGLGDCRRAEEGKRLKG